MAVESLIPPASMPTSDTPPDSISGRGLGAISVGGYIQRYPYILYGWGDSVPFSQHEAVLQGTTG
jgi:hypothetical protein